jgi:hypothetical protein
LGRARAAHAKDAKDGKKGILRREGRVHAEDGKKGVFGKGEGGFTQRR